MADCKACGGWFVSSGHEELCISCERSLKRIGGYAAPVVHGRWVNFKPVHYQCSVCGLNVGGVTSNYCPNCGAKMDKEATDGLDTP